MISRLDSIFPELAEKIRASSPAKRRQAALKACEIAALAVGLEGEDVYAAIEILRHGVTGKPIRSQLENMAACFDGEYLRLTEEGNEFRKDEMLQLFSKARAASALAFALSDDSAQSHEAIYEAIMAIDEPTDIVRSVEMALRDADIF